MKNWGRAAIPIESRWRLIKTSSDQVLDRLGDPSSNRTPVAIFFMLIRPCPGQAFPLESFSVEWRIIRHKSYIRHSIIKSITLGGQDDNQPVRGKTCPTR